MTEAVCALTVMPRSRSTGSLSRICLLSAEASTAPTSSRMRSASVDLPWSTCATMLKLRIRSRGTEEGSKEPPPVLFLAWQEEDVWRKAERVESFGVFNLRLRRNTERDCLDEYTVRIEFMTMVSSDN